MRVLFSDFQVPFRKPTVFVHNSECLHELAKSESSWHGRTVKLRGLAKYDGKLQFRTRLAQSYPPLLCIKFAGLVRETVVNMRERGDWVGGHLASVRCHSSFRTVCALLRRKLLRTVVETGCSSRMAWGQ